MLRKRTQFSSSWSFFQCGVHFSSFSWHFLVLLPMRSSFFLLFLPLLFFFCVWKGKRHFCAFFLSFRCVTKPRTLCDIRTYVAQCDMVVGFLLMSFRREECVHLFFFALLSGADSTEFCDSGCSELLQSFIQVLLGYKNPTILVKSRFVCKVPNRGNFSNIFQSFLWRNNQ